ncbi:MAG: TspO/MBR family protein [Patescibacteria group bacterium]|jgi:tryptophan-rich sensory protein
MKNKLSYIITVIAVFLVSFLGSLVTNRGMDWYETLNLPSFTPPGFFIGIVWSIIFLLSLFSILLFLHKNKAKKELYFGIIIFFFILNGILNIFWSVLFFGGGLIFWSILEMIVLNLTNLTLILLLWKNNKVSSILFWPYFLWVGFATYLAYIIYLLN